MPIRTLAVRRELAIGAPFAVPIPNDCALIGFSACSQGASIDALAGIQFANALDITIGTF